MKKLAFVLYKHNTDDKTPVANAITTPVPVTPILEKMLSLFADTLTVHNAHGEYTIQAIRTKVLKQVELYIQHELGLVVIKGNVDESKENKIVYQNEHTVLSQLLSCLKDTKYFDTSFVNVIYLTVLDSQTLPTGDVIYFTSGTTVRVKEDIENFYASLAKCC